MRKHPYMLNLNNSWSSAQSDKCHYIVYIAINIKNLSKKCADIQRLSHGVLVITRSINPRPHYQPESFSWRADNGRGLILRMIIKTLCYNLFITYSISLFQHVWRKNVSKTEEWR